MEQNIDFGKICRVCLKSGIYLQSIFRYKKDKNAQAEDLSIKMKSCYASIRRGDGFPSQICANCANLLKVAHHYFHLSGKSYAKLKKIHKYMVKKKRQEDQKANLDYDLETIELESEASDSDSDRKRLLSLSEIKKSETEYKHKTVVSNLEHTRLIDNITLPNLQHSENTFLESGDLISDSLNYKPNGHIDNLMQNTDIADSYIDDTFEISNMEESAIEKQFTLLESEVRVKKINTTDGNEISSYLVCPCKTRFDVMSSFRDHMLLGKCPEDTEQKVFKCYGCAKLFPTSDSWLNHEEKNCPYFRPGSLYKCSKCNDESACRYDFEVHIRKHTRQPLPQPHYQCGACNRIVRNKNSLAQHIETHMSGNKNYICETCGDKFRLSVSLKIHQRRHTGERPFKCMQCDYTAVQSSALRIHSIRQHGAPNKYKCVLCNKICVTPKSLKEHMAAIHEGLRNYECSECGVRYKWKRCLDKHIGSCGYVKTRQRK